MQQTEAQIILSRDPEQTYMSFKERIDNGMIARLEENVKIAPFSKFKINVLCKLTAPANWPQGEEVECITSSPKEDFIVPSLTSMKMVSGGRLRVMLIFCNPSSVDREIQRGAEISFEPIKSNFDILTSGELFNCPLTYENVSRIVQDKKLVFTKTKINKIVDQHCADYLLPFYSYQDCPFEGVIKQLTTQEDTENINVEEDLEPEGVIGIDMQPVAMTENEIIKHFENYPEGVRGELTQIFLDNRTVLSTHAFDIGHCTQKLHLELSQPVFKNTKVYPLPSEKMLQLKSFLDYLEFYGLVQRCGETEQFGNPVFVVQRKNVNSPCRLIIDCRESNKSIAGSVSATMSNVFDEVVNLSKDLVSISQLDLRQA